MLYGKKSGETKYSELVQIKDVPDTGSEPELIEVTTLKDKVKRYILGRKDSPAQSFTYNYDDEKFNTTVKAYCDGTVNDFLVVFPDGSGYAITGSAETFIKGYGTNAVIEATLTIAPEDISYKTASEVTALMAA